MFLVRVHLNNLSPTKSVIVHGQSIFLKNLVPQRLHLSSLGKTELQKKNVSSTKSAILLVRVNCKQTWKGCIVKISETLRKAFLLIQTA